MSREFRLLLVVVLILIIHNGIEIIYQLIISSLYMRNMTGENNCIQTTEVNLKKKSHFVILLKEFYCEFSSKFVNKINSISRLEIMTPPSMYHFIDNLIFDSPHLYSPCF